MGHADRATMTLIALGEDVDDGERDHVQACPVCADAMAHVRRRLLRIDDARGPTDDLPPPSVWEGIHRRLELGEDLRPDPFASARAAPRGGSSVHAAAHSRRASPRGAGRQPSVRRRAVLGGVLTAAAVGILWTAVSSFDSGTPEVPEAGPRTVASAGLTPLGDYTDTGEARVDVMVDGGRMLVVHSSNSALRGHREVWLLTPDASHMVSVGAMAGEDDAFRLPDDVDIMALPVVDISSEPDDGDPAHSGDSILRGRLDAG